MKTLKQLISETFLSKRVYSFLTLLFFIFPLIPYAQNCPALTVKDFPKEDLPKRKINIKANSADYYYGIGRPKNYRLARFAAFQELVTGTDDLVSGPPVLMMLYANGLGVHRNIDLAIKLSCGNVPGADAEIEGRAEHLAGMQNGDTADIFDQCDDITSGLMMGYCASIPSRLAKAKLNDEIKLITSGYTSEEKRKFGNLKKVAETYFRSSGRQEVNLSGTARSMFIIEREDSLFRTFVSELEISKKCIFKNQTITSASADADLSRIYKSLTETPVDSLALGTITREGIRITEHRWIPFRDAWVAFIKIRCPNINSVEWLNQITSDRVSILSNLTEQ